LYDFAFYHRVKLVPRSKNLLKGKKGLALNTVLLGACLIGLIRIDSAKEMIERIDEKIK